MTDKQIIDKTKLRKNRKDLTGMKFGKLTCLKPVKTGKNKHSEWLCECECGNLKVAQTYRLLSGRVQTCGDCYHTTNHYIPMIKELEQKYEKLRGVIYRDICSHYILGECSQKHHNNCVGRNQCIKDLEQQLDQLKEQLNAYKMETEEGKEINAELKAENEELKNTVDYLRREFKKIKWTNKAISKQCENLNCKDLQKLKQTLTEIKEIAEDFYLDGEHVKDKYLAQEILQKISECEV